MAISIATRSYTSLTDAIKPRTSVPETPVEPVPGVIEIELARGGRVRITGAAEPATVAAALRALVGR